jgi:hypothetical protein
MVDVQPVPKHIRRLVREWAGVAHERDLRNALMQLRNEFDRCERGEIDVFELHDLVHKYHDGIDREIWKRYATSHLGPAVAAAVVEGVIRKEELPPELLEHVRRWIEFFGTNR